MTFLEQYRKANHFMDYTGIEPLEMQNNEATVALDIRPENLNSRGAVHGGVLFTMADCAAGMAARGDGRLYVTQSSHMNFIRNLSEGRIYARGTVISRGRKVVLVRVQVTAEDGRLLADGTMDMFCVGDPGQG